MWHSDEEITKKIVEDAVDNGSLILFDLEYLEESYPDEYEMYVDNGIITDEIIKKCYINEIFGYIDNALGDFRYIAKNNISSKGYCWDSARYLEDVEQKIKEARDIGFYINFSSFERAIDEMCSLADESLYESIVLLDYMKGSDFDFGDLVGAVEETISPLAKEYASNKLHHARRIARRMKGSWKDRSYMAENVNHILDEITGLKKYDVFEDERIKDIRRIAYERGVEFMLEESAKISDLLPVKAEKMLRIAEINAEVLGFDVPLMMIDSD